MQTGCITGGLLSAFPPCSVDVDGEGGCGSLDDTVNWEILDCVRLRQGIFQKE